MVHLLQVGLGQQGGLPVSQSTSTQTEVMTNGKTPPEASRKPLLHFLFRNVLFLFNSHYTKQSHDNFSLHILQLLAKVFCFGVLSRKCGSDYKTVQVTDDQSARISLTCKLLLQSGQSKADSTAGVSRCSTTHLLWNQLLELFQSEEHVSQ